MANSDVIHVEVVYGPSPRTVRRVTLELPVGSTLEQAIQSSGLLTDIAPTVRKNLEIGIWGRKAVTSYVLADKDRVELYRPLTVDPKVARRERFARQGAKTAGLFSKRRDGAKSGY